MDDIQASFITERRADALKNAGHSLQVVGKHFRPSLKHGLKKIGLTRKIGGEVLDAGVGVEFVDLPDNLGV